jgi:pimeloyl-ACP methyl ester carboxylesterase
MPEVELSAGTIEYQDTGGDEPVVVLLHGLAMDGLLWRHVIRELSEDHCVVPTLPLGGHRRPMGADADPSPRGIAVLEAEFLKALDLRQVTLVGNDPGRFQPAAAHHPRVHRAAGHHRLRGVRELPARAARPHGRVGRSAAGRPECAGPAPASVGPAAAAAGPGVDGQATHPPCGHRRLAAAAAWPAADPPRSHQVPARRRQGPGRDGGRGRGPGPL